MHSNQPTNRSAAFTLLLILFILPLSAQSWENQVENFYPSDNKVNSQADSLSIEFESPVSQLSGKLYLFNGYNLAVDTVELNGERVKLTGDTLLTIYPVNLNKNWTYNILIDTGAFGPHYPGIKDHSYWNFSKTFYLRESHYSFDVGDDFIIFISLPEDYNPGRIKPYPLILKSDGNNTPASHKEAMRLHNEGKIPDCIYAGIGYNYGENDKRERDLFLCPGADKLFAFIKNDLLPYLINNYHIDPENMSYFGHSLGGSFGLYAFTRSVTENEKLFKNYIASDPSLFDENCDGKTVPELEAAINENTDSLGVNLFITASAAQGNRAVVEPFMETLHERNYKDFGLYTWVPPNTTHNSVADPTHEEGIIWALNDPLASENVHIIPDPNAPPEEEKPYMPVTQVNPDTLLNTETKTMEMVEECYNIHKLALFGFSYQLLYHSLDDRFKSEYPSYDSYKIKEDNEHSNTIYQRLFAGYNFCNKALSGLPYSPVDETTRNRLTGEVLFNRALLGFYALRLFENFPFPEDVVDYQDNYNLHLLKPDRFPNNKREALKKQITNDLEQAVDLLPLSYPESQKYRATKGAALALLGKHRLFEKKWELAVLAFENIMNSGIYQLSMPMGTDSADFVNAYLCNFSSIDLSNGDNTYTSEFNDESVFEINFYEMEGGSWHEWLPGWGTQGSLYTSYFGPHVWHNIAPTAEFVNQFESTANHAAGLKFDPRRYATVYAEGDPLGTQPGTPHYHVPFNPEQHALKDHNEGFGLRKYLFPLYYHPWSLWFANEDVNNWRLIRYSDVLLMYAEALYQLGGTQNLEKALSSLNEVRSRAGMPPVEELTPEIIMHERDVEFGGEAMRFLDLIRWSELETPWFDLSKLENFTAGEDEFLPIRPPEIENSVSYFENGDKDSLTTFTVPLLPDFAEIYYSLEEGAGNDDNDKFHIEGNILFAKDTLYYHQQRDYRILVRADDNFGGFITQKIRFRISEPSTTDYFKENSIKVWPNPVTNGKLNIDLEKGGRASVYNLQGRLILTTEISGHEYINVKNIEQGIYLLKLDYKQGSKTFRIVIQ